MGVIFDLRGSTEYIGVVGMVLGEFIKLGVQPLARGRGQLRVIATPYCGWDVTPKLIIARKLVRRLIAISRLGQPSIPGVMP